jgi:hypothetical protein
MGLRDESKFRDLRFISLKEVVIEPWRRWRMRANFEIKDLRGVFIEAGRD